MILKHWIFVLITLVLVTASNVSIADVGLKNRNKDCKKNCSQKLTVGNKTFYYNHKAKLQLSAIYHDIEWALVSVPIKNNKRTITHYYLHSSNSRNRFSTTKMCTGLDRDISAQGEIVCISSEKVEVVGDFSGNQDKTYPLSGDALVAVVDHYKGGVINLAYISETKNEYDAELLEYQLNVNDLGNLKKSNSSWLTEMTSLHKNSDFNNILAVSSRGDGQYSAAVYEWINPYNKGLVAYNFSPKSEVSVGKINASEMHNFGFNPKVEITKAGVKFSALNSSSGARETFSYSNTELTQMNYEQHEFSNASYFEFMFGAGFQPSFWSVNQKVEVGEQQKAKTEYDMNTNVLTSYYMQGRWGDSQIAVSLLQNKAKEKVNHAVDNDLLQEVVKKYIVQYDYHGLFSGASTLRLVYGSMNAGGIATYQIDNEEKSEYAFESKRVIYKALVMAEKGMYWGGYHSTYNSPSMVGFVNENGYFSGAAFDKDFKLTKYGMVFGYDEGWYGSRYETDYNRWYITGEFGIGGVYLHTNRDTLFDAVGTREGDINGKNTIELKGTLDVGYIWQRRIKSLKGLGMSILAGYQAQYEYINQNSDDEDELDSGWTLHYQRQDIIHGPYVKLNIIF
jgi:hypothetical protein